MHFVMRLTWLITAGLLVSQAGGQITADTGVPVVPAVPSLFGQKLPALSRLLGLIHHQTKCDHPKCTGRDACYKSCKYCCKVKLGVIKFNCHNKCGGCLGPSCRPWPSKCDASHCVNCPSCMRSGNCYRKCTPCCSGVKGSICRTGQCNNSVCYAADCRTLQKVCMRRVCTISAGCPRLCTKCCAGPACSYSACGGCLAPGCKEPAPPSPLPTPSAVVYPPGLVYAGMYRCEWDCTRRGRKCSIWCRKCCIGNPDSEVCVNSGVCWGSCRNSGTCGARPPPQKPVCGRACMKVDNCYTMCNCCCLNGTCKNTGLCARACFRSPNCK